MTSSRSAGEVDRRAFLQGIAAGAVGLGLAGTLGPRAFAEEGAEAKGGKVKRRTLGRTGVSVSSIAVGGGGLTPESVPLLQAAYDHGVDFIDVAWGYGQGQAERGVGAFLEKFPHRDRIFLSTKASGFSPPRGTSAEVYAAFKSKVQECLQRMRTDYVDLLMWPHGASDPGAFRNPAMREALQKLKEEKLVRFFGTSSHANYAATAGAAVEDGFYDVVLVVLNVCTQNADKAGQPEGERQRGRTVEDTRALLAAAKQKNVGIMAMKVANPGFLSPAADDLLAAAFPEGSPLSRHQKLYAYGLRQEAVSTVVVGMRTVTHLREAVQIGSA